MAKKAATSASKGRKKRKAGKGKMLVCAKGYHFEKVTRNRVALIRNDGGGLVVVCKCVCSGPGSKGNCTVSPDPKDGSKLACYNEGACSGTCIWKISISGLQTPLFIF